MNALIPALLAVLLAETGGSLASLDGARRKFAVAVWCALAIAAAIGGALVATRITLPARTLLAGLALVFAAMTQLGRASKIPHPLLAALRAPSPFIVFAFAARLGAPLTLVGSATGLALAMLAPSIPYARRIGGGLLGLAGLWAGLSALRIL